MWNIITELPKIFASIQKNHKVLYECQKKTFILECTRILGWREQTIERWLPRLEDLGYINIKGNKVVQLCRYENNELIPYKFTKGQVKL